VNDLFSIEGKVALVTGGSRGIGLMIARGFVQSGARVYVSSRKAEACEEAAAELSKQGTCIALPADVSDETGCQRLAAELSQREPRLHVLVNNAGANWGAPLAEYPDAAWDKVLALNVKSVFHLTRALLAPLEAAAAEDGPARVINVGSIDGLHVPALEIAPGPFESKMMAETLRRFGDAIAASCPLGRIGAPEDMAGVAVYLASRAGAYVTGAVLPVDGGISTTL
jgi:NAD(P)-dependent dehydrogenase (short-subunit alcohol dehydrogenase family)